LRHRTIDDAISATVEQTHGGDRERMEVEAALWKFIENLSIYDGPVTLYPDKKISQLLKNELRPGDSL